MQGLALRGLKEESISKVKIVQDDGTEWLLEYFLQTCKRPGEDVFYGLKVEKSTTDGVLVEREETFVTESYDEAVAMVTAFAKGTVPPRVLFEMVDEWEWKR